MTHEEAKDVVLDESDRLVFQPGSSAAPEDDSMQWTFGALELNVGDSETIPLSPKWPGVGPSEYLPLPRIASVLLSALSTNTSSASSSPSNSSSCGRWRKLSREERRTDPYP